MFYITFEDIDNIEKHVFVALDIAKLRKTNSRTLSQDLGDVTAQSYAVTAIGAYYTAFAKRKLLGSRRGIAALYTALGADPVTYLRYRVGKIIGERFFRVAAVL